MDAKIRDVILRRIRERVAAGQLSSRHRQAGPVRKPLEPMLAIALFVAVVDTIGALFGYLLLRVLT